MNSIKKVLTRNLMTSAKCQLDKQVYGNSLFSLTIYWAEFADGDKDHSNCKHFMSFEVCKIFSINFS